jgi:4-hydroxy-4-methyl-2-oxoglutarate aldolase
MKIAEEDPMQWQRLAKLGTATVHEAIGNVGAIDPAIRAIRPGMQIVGLARTVDLPGGDNLMLHVALSQQLGGRVLVVNAKACLTAGPWGEVMTTAALAAGCGGLVIDGAVRDSNRIAELGFPVFSSGLSIQGTSKTKTGQIGAPVTVGGVIVRDGDLIIGDEDGLVAVPADRLDTAFELSQQRADKEERLLSEIRNGATTLDLLGLREAAKSLGVIP